MTYGDKSLIANSLRATTGTSFMTYWIVLTDPLNGPRAAGRQRTQISHLLPHNWENYEPEFLISNGSTAHSGAILSPSSNATLGLRRTNGELVTIRNLTASALRHTLPGKIWIPLMPRGGTKPPPGPSHKSPGELREQAMRVRGHAQNNVGDRAERQMLDFAEELETQATALEVKPFRHKKRPPST
jgi:hypothetical protein